MIRDDCRSGLITSELIDTVAVTGGATHPEGDALTNNKISSIVGTVAREDGSQIVMVLPDIIGPKDVPGFVTCALVPLDEYENLVKRANALSQNIEFRRRIGGQVDPERGLDTALAAIELVRAVGDLEDNV